METADRFHLFGAACQEGVLNELQAWTGILLSDTCSAEGLSGEDGGAVCCVLETGKRGYFFEGIGEKDCEWLIG